MRIAEVRVFVLKLEHDEPYLGRPPAQTREYWVREPWRSLYSPRFEALLVELATEDGTTGWGEALAPVAPEVPGEAVARLLRPVLTGAELTGLAGPRPLTHRLRELMRERGHLVGHQADALAAVDIALWDLAGRAHGLPVAALLGGAFRERVPTYFSGLPRPADAERAALAAEWAARGARRIKLHLGHGVDADLATVDAVLAADARLSVAVDAHWAYRLPEAARLARELAERGRVLFLEAPLAPEDLAGHAALAARSELPIAVGETLRNRFEFDAWLSAGAIGLAQPDVGRTGITEAMAIASLCEARHVPLAPHHSTGLGVAMAAGLHVAAAVQACPFFEYQPTTAEVAGRILAAPLEATAADVVLPTGAGLGVQVDLDFVRTNAKEL
jgi:L-alanine-DL-glutamate epimerase-like enolase superfamily enzyme